MKDSTPHSFAAERLRELDRPSWLRALFLPEPCRESVMVLLALQAELAHIPHAASEEIAAHMRYAWWQDAIAHLGQGKPPAHPLLRALEALIGQGLVSLASVSALVDAYRAGQPADSESSVLPMIESQAPASISAWHKAGAVINRHRARYGAGARVWLAFKLLFLR